MKKDQLMNPSLLNDKFLVRMPEHMRQKIAEAAKRNRRSMNSECLVALDKHLAEQEKNDG